MYKLIILGAILTVVYSTEVQKCADAPHPIEVRIKGCDKQPCKVVKGTSGEFEVDFNTPHPVSSLKTKVLATALGITIPYKLPEDVANVCKNLANQESCPLNPNKKFTYKFAFPISRIYPEIRVHVKISIVDENNTAISCFGVNIQVAKQ